MVGEGAPPALENVEQGGTYWGVIVAVADDGDYIQRVADRMIEQGVPVSWGDVECDQGGGRRFGDGIGLQRVAAYFATSDEAERFADALDPPPVAVARVTVYCLD